MFRVLFTDKFLAQKNFIAKTLSLIDTGIVSYKSNGNVRIVKIDDDTIRITITRDSGKQINC